MINWLQLYRNEMTKILHRRILPVVAILIVLVSIGISFLLKDVQADSQFAPITAAHVDQELDTLRDTTELEKLDEDLRAMEASGQNNTQAASWMYDDYGFLKAQQDRATWIENHRELYQQMGGNTMLLDAYFEFLADEYTYQRTPMSLRTTEDTTAYMAGQLALLPYREMIERGTLEDLLTLSHEFRHGDLDTELAQRILDYELKLARAGGSPANILTMSLSYESAIRAYVEATSDTERLMVHLPSEMNEIENRVKIYEYRAERAATDPIGSLVANAFYYVLMTFATFFVSLLVIVIAGNQISGERASGSIKSLILAPVKRHKIVTAKLTATLTILTFFVFFASLTATLCMRLILDTTLQPYLYIAHSTVLEMTPFWYGVKSALLANIPSLFFMLFAFMLSAIGVPTAGAVGISMGMRFGVTPLLTLLYEVLDNTTWMKFLPFNHLDLQMRILPIDNTYAAGGITDIFTATLKGPQTSIAFSCIWIGLIGLAMLITAYETFTRMDL